MKINLLPKKTWKQTLWKTINVVSSISLIFNMSMLGVFVTPKVTSAAVPNPDFSTVTWSPYQLNGHTVTDFEDNVCGINDYSKGPANVAPDSVDLASNAQVGPPCENPGDAATLQTGSNADYLFFRIRLDDTPISSGGGGKYLSYHWDVLMDTDGNNTSDYVVDLNGSGNLPGLNGSSHSGILGVYTNDPGLQTFDPANFVWQAEASATTDIYTHVQATTENASQYWLDLAIPKASIPFSSYVNLFASTSASNTDPLQKDWMASEAFFIELVQTKSVQNLTNPGNTTITNPARPGDVLRYTLTVTNNGNRTAPGYVVTDDVSDIVQYTTDPTNFNPATGSYNTTTKFVSWPQTDIAPAATLTDKFEVTVKPMNQWPSQGDFTISNVYGNEIILKFCDLKITKAVDKTTASVGDTLEYTLTYTNDGEAACTGTGAKIYDALDSHLTYNGTHSENVTGDTDGQGITFEGNFNGTDPVANVHVVSPGEAGTITFQATINAPARCGDFDIPNQAKIWSNETGDVLSNSVNTHVPMVCYGSLKVYKYVDSGSATPDQWSFTTNSQTLTPASGQNYVVFSDLLSGSYDVTESALAGYHQVSSTCDDVSVVAGQQATCEFHNARDTGTITVNKKVDANGDGTFEGGNTEANALGFDWGLDGGTVNRDMGTSATSVPTGNHSVTENNITNYHFVGWYPTGSTQYGCDNPQSTSLPASIDVSKDATTSITLCNARNTGDLTINKAVDTDGDGQIDETNPAGWTWDLDAGNQNYAMGSTRNVITGNHTVSEDQHANFSATGWICSDQTSGSGETLNVNVPSTGVTCTFTNVRDTGQLTVIKHVVGGTAVASDWTMHIDNLYSFPGSETGETRTLVTGNYQVTETNGPADYTLTYSGNCDSNGNVTINKGDNKTCTLTNTRDKGWLKLIKHVVNDDGGNDSADDFTLRVKQGGVDVSGSPAAGSETGALYNLETGVYTVSESPHTGYTQTSIVCDGQNTDTANVTNLNSITNPVICTITNDDEAPTITLIKSVTNDNGGNALPDDFNLTIGGNPALSGVTYPVDANTPYALDETQLPGYTFVGITGNAKCPSVLGGTATLDEGEDITCTITNDDIAPKLKLIKYVTNDNGGTLDVPDFPLFVDGSPVTSGNWNEVLANVEHTATETSDPDYAASTWSGDCAADGKITLQPGDEKICSITNDDIQPKLTVTKIVVNDNGGTLDVPDFPLFVDATPVTSGVENGFNAGNYVVSETNQTGYATTINGDCDINGNVTLNIGDVKSCTITNDDEAATLKVIKHVINDNGGNNVAADFTMYATGTNVSDPSFAGDESGVEVTLDAGAYHVSEDGPAGYAADYSTDCSGTMNVGDYKTCTVTNDDIAPTITLIKNVINDNGGTAGENDFGLTIGATAVNSDQPLAVNANTPIALNEAGLYGYNFVSITGNAKCPSVLGGTATLDEGENITCTITNDDIQPKLTVTKIVVNDNGGTLDVPDFPLFVDATSVTSGVENGFDAGNYVVSETNQTGYAATINGDCDVNGNITLNVGDVKSCTITNDDIAPKLKLIKYVTNDNGGTLDVPDFPLFIDGSPVTSGNWNEVLANVEYTATETSDPDYAASTWSGDCAEDGKITLLPGDEKTCYIANDDIPGKITGYKYDNEDNPLDGWEICLSGGAIEDGVDFDFGITVFDIFSLNLERIFNGNCVFTGAGDWPDGYYEFTGLSAGLYTLTETVQPGWQPVNPASGQYTDVPVTIGQTTNRDFVNRQIYPDLTIEKDDGKLTANAGENLTYNIIVQNVGEYKAEGITVVDTLPAHLTYVSDTSGVAVNQVGQVLTWDFPSAVLDVSQTMTFTVTVKIDDVMPFGTTTLHNVITVSTDSYEPNTSNNSAFDNTDVSAAPVLGLTKTAPAQVNAGDNITYTINWSVSGDSIATQVVLWDPIPTNTTFVSADNGGTYDAVTNKVTWDLGTKNPGDSGTVHMVVKTNSPLADGTIITNTAYLDSAETDPALQAVARTEIVSGPILNITKSDTPDPVKPGENINYTINWSISGNDTAHNVKITDVIPTNTTYVSVADGGVYDVLTNTITWTLGTKNPGDSGSVHFVVKVNTPLTNGTVIKNTVTIDSDETPPTSADANTTVIAAPVLKITKSVDQTFVNPGGTANYTVVIENTGNDTAINVKLNDLLPSGFTFTEFGTNTHTFSLGNLAAGAKVSVTYNVTIGTGVAAGTYENLAVAWADNHGNVTAKVPLEVRVPKVLGEEPKPELAIDKTVDKDIANPGNVITYTVKVTNNGDATAVNVQLQDVLPAGFTFDGSDNISKTWDLGDILVGETKQVTYSVKIDDKIIEGKYENLAVAWADNHDQVTDFVTVEVRTVKVLAETGPGTLDFLYFFGAGTVLLTSFYVLSLTRRREEK